MATLGAVAFAILFKAGPADAIDLEGEKARQDLAKFSKKEEAKKEREHRQEQKKKEEKKKAQAAKAPQPAKPKREPEPEEKEEDNTEFYVANLPIQNNTPQVSTQKQKVSL